MFLISSFMISIKIFVVSILLFTQYISQQQPTLWQLIREYSRNRQNPEFRILGSFLQKDCASPIRQALDDPTAQLTIFAPTDAAFRDFYGKSFNPAYLPCPKTVIEEPCNPSILKPGVKLKDLDNPFDFAPCVPDYVAYHMIYDQVVTVVNTDPDPEWIQQYPNGRKRNFPSALNSSSMVALNNTNQTLLIEEFTNGTSVVAYGAGQSCQITQNNIEASNGVLQMINAVLTPPYPFTETIKFLFPEVSINETDQFKALVAMNSSTFFLENTPDVLSADTLTSLSLLLYNNETNSGADLNNTNVLIRYNETSVAGNRVIVNMTPDYQMSLSSPLNATVTRSNILLQNGVLHLYP